MTYRDEPKNNRRKSAADTNAGKAATENEAITKPNIRNLSEGVQGTDRQSAMNR